MREKRYQVSVLNPAVLVAYRKSQNKRSKNDALDAWLLACYGRDHHLATWSPLPEEILKLRALLAYRQDVLGMCRQELNRLEAGRLDQWGKQQVQLHVAWLKQQRKQVEQRIFEHLTDCQSWHLLQTIPGFGPQASAVFIAHVGEISRFRRASSVVSLAGVAVVQSQSGTSVRGREHIDRHGRRELRSVLYMCALASMRTDSSMKAWAHRLTQRGKPGKVVVIAVVRKLVHIAFGVWKHAQAYDPSLAFA